MAGSQAEEECCSVIDEAEAMMEEIQAVKS